MDNTQKLYPYREVFYKTDDTPGWYIAVLAGDDQIVEAKCKQLWTTYHILSGGEWASEVEDHYPYNPYACDAHMRTNWIYSKELNKWFMPDEIIPTPTSKCPNFIKFEISHTLDEEENTNDDLKNTLFDDLSLFGEEAVVITTNISFKAGNTEYSIQTLYAHYYDDSVSKFLNRIKKGEFSYFIIEEYWYTKLLVWTVGNQCRVKIQSYQDAEDSEPLDFIIQKDVCIKIFSKFFDDIDKDYKKLEEMTLESLSDKDREYLRQRHKKYNDRKWRYNF